MYDIFPAVVNKWFGIGVFQKLSRILDTLPRTDGFWSSLVKLSDPLPCKLFNYNLLTGSGRFSGPMALALRSSSLRPSWENQ